MTKTIRLTDSVHQALKLFAVQNQRATLSDAVALALTMAQPLAASITPPARKTRKARKETTK